MGYNQEVTRKASQHVDKLVAYLLNPLKNGQAHPISFLESMRSMPVWKKTHGSSQSVPTMC